jgi:hypothetical protein
MRKALSTFREPLFRLDPQTNAMCYGFIEKQQNGQRIIGHDGATLWFHSLMQLIPDRHVGFFVCCNTDTGAGLSPALFKAFLDRYFPAPDPPRVKPAEGFAERARKIVGEYVTTRYSHASVTKLTALGGTLQVSANNDDTLSIAEGDRVRRFVEVEPFVFQEIEGQQKVVFQQTNDGRVSHLSRANAPQFAAVRQDWYASSILQQSMLLASVGIFLSALFF